MSVDEEKPYTSEELDKKLLSFADTRLDFPFGEDVAVYRVHDKMFALLPVGTRPARISLKCDPQLAEVLRERYESVLPGYHLNKKHWNTIIVSGQLSRQEIEDLIRHSYDLVAA